MNITEEIAAIEYAKAWNELDYTDFLKLLDKNVHCASQYALEELTNKNSILNYLENKIKTVRKLGIKICAEVGNTQLNFAGKDFLLIV